MSFMQTCGTAKAPITTSFAVQRHDAGLVRVEVTDRLNRQAADH